MSGGAADRAARDAAARDRLGDLVANKYRLESVVASGGMGVVYQAEHLRLGRRVAVKLLHPEHASDDKHVRRFHQEAKKAASLVHPGIIDVRDFGWDGAAGPFLEMELLEGSSVDQVLSTHGQLPADVCCYVGIEVLEALSAAHARNVVHRDLKPQNLFVALEPTGHIRVKVLDFGIAKIFTSDLDPNDSTYTETLTKTGVVLGTLNYMSPEQFADSRNVATSSDLYSVGASLFELLTGVPVVEGGTVFECISRVAAGEIRRHPKELRPEIPDWLDHVVAQALARDPNKRFIDARDMARTLREGSRLEPTVVEQKLRILVEDARAVEAAGPVSGSILRPGSDAPPPVSELAETAAADASGQAEEARGPSSSPPTEVPATSEARTAPETELTGFGAATEIMERPTSRPKRRRWWIAVALALVAGLGGFLMVDTLRSPGDETTDPSTAATAAEDPTVPVDVEQATDTRPGEEEEPTPAPTETEPGATGGEAETVATEEGTDDEAEAAEAESEEAESEEAEPTRRGRRVRRPRQGRAPVRPIPVERTTRERPSPPEVTGERGTLVINTIPSARVFLDGRNTGQDTPVNGMAVPVGTHTLELRVPGGRTHRFQIRVEPGEEVRIFRVLPN